MRTLKITAILVAVLIFSLDIPSAYCIYCSLRREYLSAQAYSAPVVLSSSDAPDTSSTLGSNLTSIAVTVSGSYFGWIEDFEDVGSQDHVWDYAGSGIFGVQLSQDIVYNGSWSVYTYSISTITSSSYVMIYYDFGTSDNPTVERLPWNTLWVTHWYCEYTSDGVDDCLGNILYIDDASDGNIDYRLVYYWSDGTWDLPNYYEVKVGSLTGNIGVWIRHTANWVDDFESVSGLTLTNPSLLRVAAFTYSSQGFFNVIYVYWDLFFPVAYFDYIFDLTNVDDVSYSVRLHLEQLSSTNLSSILYLQTRIYNSAVNSQQVTIYHNNGVWDIQDTGPWVTILEEESLYVKLYVICNKFNAMVSVDLYLQVERQGVTLWYKTTVHLYT